MKEKIINDQKGVCKKYGTEFFPSPTGWKIGVSKNLSSGEMPINGLRHPPQNGTLGWYIWAGREDINNDPNFWNPIHVEHLADFGKLGDLILKYLGLPPGWRFQIDDKGYEDVWEDKKLLNV